MNCRSLDHNIIAFLVRYFSDHGKNLNTLVFNLAVGGALAAGVGAYLHFHMGLEWGQAALFAVSSILFLAAVAMGIVYASQIF